VLSKGGGESPPNGDKNKTVGSYAKITEGNIGRKKLNVMDIMLERRDNSVSFNLSKEELAKLLFEKMKLNPKEVRVIDTLGLVRSMWS